MKSVYVFACQSMDKRKKKKAMFVPRLPVGVPRSEQKVVELKAAVRSADQAGSGSAGGRVLKAKEAAVMVLSL